MFKICIWYVLKKEHILHKTISRYSETFSCGAFPAHITIQHSLNHQEAHDIWTGDLETYNFYPYGNPIQTATKIGSDTFYAIEQPLKVLNIAGIYHISLAYRMNKEFQAFELAVIGRLDPILKEDLEICVADCNGEVKDWKVLYK
tara:strand:- start:2397 stop:2831 length:435 start_codon:yes stop_codon:yes gene_type:complete